MSDPLSSFAVMTTDPPNNSSDAPADEFPILKLGLDPDRPDTLTDVTDQVGEIDFDAGDRFRFRSFRRARNAQGGQNDPVAVDLLEDATLHLEEVRPGDVRTALRHAAVEGAHVRVEFYPDGERAGALRISASCLVTFVSIRAYDERYRYRGRRRDPNDPPVRRDDRFELTFVSDATHERL